MGQTKTLRDHASELADTLAPHVETARDKAAPLLADARDKAAPVIADVRAKAAPVLAEARDKAAPVIADAREKAAPYIADAHDRLTTEVVPLLTAALATVEAATLEARQETLKRGKAVAAALKGEVEPPPKKHRARWALLLLAVGGAIFAASRKLGSRQPTTNWQSSYTPPPTPTAPTSGGPVAGTEGGLHRAGSSPDDTAASDPAEAVSDSTDVPHDATTPDNPVTEVDVDRQ
jgi:vacuolar-type H+-ATPase subunit H